MKTGKHVKESTGSDLAVKAFWLLIFIAAVTALVTIVLLRDTEHRETTKAVNNTKEIMATQPTQYPVAIFTPGEGPVYTELKATVAIPEADPEDFPTLELSDEMIKAWIAESQAELEAMHEAYYDYINAAAYSWDDEPAIEIKETSSLVVERVRPTKETISSDPDTALAEVISWITLEDGSLDYSRMSDMGVRYITGYDCCEQCCGKPVTDRWYGYTASGRYVKEGRTCALNGYAFGTVVYIEGLGFRVVEDRGGMKNGNIDVYCHDHPTCYSITGSYQVYLVWSPEG